MLKKNMKIITAIMLATTIALGSGASVVYGETTEGINTSSIVEAEKESAIRDGVYRVKNNTEYITPGNATGESMARRALKDITDIEVKDGKVQMTLKFSDSLYGFMKNIRVKLGETPLEVVENAQNKSVTFTVPSIDSKVLVEMKITIMGRDVQFYVTNDMNTLETLNEAPLIESKISGDKILKAGESFDPLTLVSAKDKEDGDITNKVQVVENTVNADVPGKYKVVYEVSDSGNLKDSKTINVVVESNGKPVINGVDNKSIKKGENFNSMDGVSAIDEEDGDITGKLKVSGSVDVNKKGDYNLLYSVEDSHGNKSEKQRVISVIEEDKVPENNEEQNNALKDGNYSIKNSVLYVGSGNAQIGNDMARKVLSETSHIEVKNGKTLVTLTFDKDQYSFIGNIKVSVDGKEVNIDRNDKNRTIKFEIPSLDSEIMVSTFVTIMNREVSFKTQLLKDTLKSEGQAGNETVDKEEGGSSSSNNSGTSNGDTADKNSSKVEDKKEDKKEVVKGKLYTIENRVTHPSQTGVDMARKYLNKVSDVQEVNGKTYVTLTFTGVDFMKDYEIYVNGSKVNYEVVSKDKNSIKLKFEVPNLDAAIKVKTYVVPMSRNVEFGVELLKDTLKFVKEYTVDKLPQTGSMVNTESMSLLGFLMMGSSAILFRKKKN